uniref:(northern house mosquito) hypothetical protein n=1 Tax=Culex pipiens TaxID=7175 RepID=A0A8D8IA38_CULPI
MLRYRYQQRDQHQEHDYHRRESSSAAASFMEPEIFVQRLTIDRQSTVTALAKNDYAGIEGRGLDSEAKERVKLLREEDQRSEMKYMHVAARKLQELEQKQMHNRDEDGGPGSSPAKLIYLRGSVS